MEAVSEDLEEGMPLRFWHPTYVAIGTGVLVPFGIFVGLDHGLRK